MRKELRTTPTRVVSQGPSCARDRKYSTSDDQPYDTREMRKLEPLLLHGCAAQGSKDEAMGLVEARVEREALRDKHHMNSALLALPAQPVFCRGRKSYRQSALGIDKEE